MAHVVHDFGTGAVTAHVREQVWQCSLQCLGRVGAMQQTQNIWLAQGAYRRAELQNSFCDIGSKTAEEARAA